MESSFPDEAGSVDKTVFSKIMREEWSLLKDTQLRGMCTVGKRTIVSDECKYHIFCLRGAYPLC